MKTANRSFVFLATCAVLWLGASAASAQRSNGSLSTRGYEEMRRLAQRLDATAQHAADQARHQDSWIYRHDSRFSRAVSDFARRADRFNARMATYRTAPWQVDDELRGLLRNAQEVQALARRSREADEHTVSDWNDAVRVLNRMIQLWDNDVRRRGRYDWNSPLPEFRDEGPRSEYERPRGQSERRGYPDDRRAMEQLGTLARELDERAGRANQLAQSVPGGRGGRYRESFDTIYRFNAQTREFDRRVSSGQANVRELREEARRLLDDARRADAEMRQNNVFPEVWGEWQAAMQVLDRILGLLGS